MLYESAIACRFRAFAKIRSPATFDFCNTIGHELPRLHEAATEATYLASGPSKSNARVFPVKPEKLLSVNQKLLATWARRLSEFFSSAIGSAQNDKSRMPQAPAIQTHDFQIEFVPTEGGSFILFDGDSGTSPFRCRPLVGMIPSVLRRSIRTYSKGGDVTPQSRRLKKLRYKNELLLPTMSAIDPFRKLPFSLICHL
jgi:hypothetical protein